jgi:predicted nucleotidyltransferase
MATKRKTSAATLDDIKDIIRRHRTELKSQFHVERIGVFGSFARGTQHKQSDVDFLVTFDRPVSLLDHAGLNLYLQEIVGREVDVISRDSLRPELREFVHRELVLL